MYWHRPQHMVSVEAIHSLKGLKTLIEKKYAYADLYGRIHSTPVR